MSRPAAWGWGFAAGLAAGVLLASAIVAATVRAAPPAPRSAAVIPAGPLGSAEQEPRRTGAPEALATLAPTTPAVSPVGTSPDSSAKRRAPGTAQPAATPPAAKTPAKTPSPSRAPRAARAPRLVASGTASFVDPSYGPSYLALPKALGGRGRLVRLCLGRRCVTRRSTDAGPVAALHRVADVSFRDAAFLCGCDPRVPGLLRGVEVFAL